ncbi:DUF4760 domain-containing protein [Sphingomonas aerolata]|uniref:DUF4760 domain-containing protein n=1 Tax=Sphingomonas aerolata TaxID=185951 RepID=UPI00334DBF7E
MGLTSALYSFWHTYGSDIQNGAVVLSAVAAFAVIRDSRRTARRRGTLDLILHQQSDAELVKSRGEFNKIKAGTERPSSYGKAGQEASVQFETIRKVLNIHELTAVAINEGVIDELVYRRWFNSTLINDREAMKDFMVEVRKTHNAPAAFCEFDKLAKRWRDDPNWNDSPGWFARKRQAAIKLFHA